MLSASDPRSVSDAHRRSNRADLIKFADGESDDYSGANREEGRPGHGR